MSGSPSLFPPAGSDTAQSHSLELPVCVCVGGDLIDIREESTMTTMEVMKSTSVCSCDCIIRPCLDKHLAVRARLDGGAVD